MVQKIETTRENTGQEITLVQIQVRRKYENTLVEQHQKRVRKNLYPISYTRYMNMGYWKGGAQTHDEAGEGLARLVGEAGQFSSGDYILDAGCGFAEQDMFWIGHFGVGRITAIDINSDAISVARDRASECGLADRLELKVTSAVEMPFKGDTYDKVVALESAVQFMRREDFFHEAHRVLRPGGRLVASDMIPRNGRQVRHPAANPVNMYSRDVYARKLELAGFTNVCLTSIRQYVINPFNRYLERHEKVRSLRGLVNRLMRRYASSSLDYIIVTADKPHT
jgi:ubiquinone/menaquinone biosynthesis C-methylase UbiE